MSRSKPPVLPVLNEKWAAFVQGGVSLVVASRDVNNVPTMARAVGCRVSPNRQKITLFLQTLQAESLIAGVRSTGAIAAVFTQPSTHTSLQLKGTEAQLGSVKPSDLAVVKRSTEGFVADVVPLGYSEDLMRAIVWSDPKDLVSLTFTPVSAFIQTPGPRAGEPLGA
jgi:hypothetical protein